MNLRSSPEAEDILAADSKDSAFIDLSKSIGECFRNVVERHGDRTAVLEGERQHKYSDLDAASDSVAARLLEACGPGNRRVALLLSHGWPAIVGLLGALKAGKAYVPIDPNQPRERIRRIASNADVEGWVVDVENAGLAGDIVDEKQARMVTVDGPSGEHLARNPVADARAAPESDAYLIYTSGSTGTPKGVVQTHRSVLHYLRRFTNCLSIGPEDKYTQIASYAFEAGVKSILAPLLTGATVCPIDIRKLNGPALQQWLHDTNVTVWHSVPTMYREFIARAVSSIELKTMRLVVLSGEELLASDLEGHWRSVARSAQAINLYGLTEASLNLLWKANPDDRTPIRLGYPFRRGEVKIIDSNGEPARADEIGEIAIESECVAKGYWGDEGLTRDRFTALPNGGVRFRTGDLGRWLPNGSVQPCGRSGTQVKIRGFRVELGEVENALLETRLVGQAAVLARNHANGNQRLVAYLTPTAGGGIDLDQVRRELRSKLPDYMVPAQFAQLEKLPLTSSGKLDREALPEWREQGSGEYTAPRTPVEQALSSIWAEILQVDGAGIHDDFFELGGDSLLAIQLVARIHERLGMEVPIRTIFENSTIAALVLILDAPEQASRGERVSGKSGDGFDTIEF